MNTWDELVEAFMGRFFPPALTSKRRREIIIFKQGEDEISIMLRKGIRRCSKDVQCLGLI